MKPRRSTNKGEPAPTETLQVVTQKPKQEDSFIAASSGRPEASGASVALPEIPELAQATSEQKAAAKGLQGEHAKSAGVQEIELAGQENFQTIADTMPELISYVDAEQRYQFTNKTYEKWYGVPAEDFKGRQVREVLGEAGYATVKPYIEKALAGECTSFEGYFPHERMGRRYLHADYVPQKIDGDKVSGFYLVIGDWTQLKEAEEKCRTFLETAPDAMIICDSQGKISMVNAQTERMFGYSRQELIGQPIEILMPERFREAHVFKRRAYDAAPVSCPMGTGLELYALRKDGSEIPIEVNLSPIETADGIFISSTIRDVTERKQLAEQIRWAAILEERSRMARDIHDTLAQGFTGIILNLEAVEEACADLPEAVRERITRAREVARESLEEARRSILTLSTALLPGVNLATCLQGMAERYRSMSTKTRVEVSVRGAPFRLDPVIEENLCHIAQQATDNALQHALASTVRIELAFDKKHIRLQIKDDGRGFDVKKARRGLGLTGIRERANAIGGKLTLNSQLGKGTCVEVKVALPITTRAAASP
jgi:PAS domain S-box-containing protein